MLASGKGHSSHVHLTGLHFQHQIIAKLAECLANAARWESARTLVRTCPPPPSSGARARHWPGDRSLSSFSAAPQAAIPKRLRLPSRRSPQSDAPRTPHLSAQKAAPPLPRPLTHRAQSSPEYRRHQIAILASSCNGWMLDKQSADIKDSRHAGSRAEGVGFGRGRGANAFPSDAQHNGNCTQHPHTHRCMQGSALTLLESVV